ncbi:MAG: type IV pilin [Methanocorpusculum sp.]|uniref:type IV pilin n=1 Tax=Methanocorpusculum sp. TaxID=2058474 RepID=UPI002725D51B|nr:type IV pilin [Methanocorpusculum sp.]MDO9523036.1 type IV pilin [Methanocorpusculum sp.]
MIIKHTTKKDNAVSPVVGVMLMLVVTIIIAAVVAAFAGGVVTTTDKAPFAVIKATYSQSSGLLLTEISGDVLSGVDVYVRPGDGFSSSYSKLAWKTLSSVTLSPGSVTEVAAVNIQPATDGAPNSGVNSGENDGKNSGYGFNNATKSVGKFIEVDIYKNGKVVATTTTAISA